MCSEGGGTIRFPRHGHSHCVLQDVWTTNLTLHTLPDLMSCQTWGGGRFIDADTDTDDAFVTQSGSHRRSQQSKGLRWKVQTQCKGQLEL